MKFVFILSIVVLIFGSCQSDSNATTESNIEINAPEPTHYSDAIDTTLITIISLNNITWIADADRPAELSTTEFEEIEELINAAVNEYNVNALKRHEELLEFYREGAEFMETAPPDDFPISDTIPDYSKYFRQYIPYYNLQGDKKCKIYLNCSVYEQWKTEVYQVNDGGNCHFKVLLNLTTGKCEQIMVNGYA